MSPHGSVVRLQIASDFEMVDLVQTVSDHLGRLLGFDEDAMHWIGVAVRESVINAIKHGNQNDRAKFVSVEFCMTPEVDPCELSVSVKDEGEGFDLADVENPLAPENLLKASGRGIFLMRNFMDEVVLRRCPDGGMEVRMLKKVESV